MIIPTLNEEENIKDTIFSVKSQTTKLTYEILVCDGGSTDRTVEIAQNYAKVISSPKRGKVTQINYAVKQANGKILIFLDADTVLPDNYFKKIFRIFQTEKNLIACSVPHIYRSNKLISAGTIFFSLLLLISSPLLFALLTLFQLMFYFFLWDKRFFPITKYYGLNQLMYLYYIGRAFWHFIEFSGSNICIRSKIFKRIGGFKPVPNSKGVDAIFSSALRKFCGQNKSYHIKMVNSLAVLTDPRFVSRKRILKRIRQHKQIANYYEKVSKNQIKREMK